MKLEPGNLVIQGTNQRILTYVDLQKTMLKRDAWAMYDGEIEDHRALMIIAVVNVTFSNEAFKAIDVDTNQFTAILLLDRGNPKWVIESKGDEEFMFSRLQR